MEIFTKDPKPRPPEGLKPFTFSIPTRLNPIERFFAQIKHQIEVKIKKLNQDTRGMKNEKSSLKKGNLNE